MVLGLHLALAQVHVGDALHLLAEVGKASKLQNMRQTSTEARSQLGVCNQYKQPCLIGQGCVPVHVLSWTLRADGMSVGGALAASSALHAL